MDFLATNEFLLAPADEHIAPSNSAVRALTALTGMSLGVAYMVAITYVSSMSHDLTFLPAKIAFAVLSISLVVAAFRNKMSVALWGVMYFFGLFVDMAFGRMIFGDAVFMAQVYTGAGAVVGLVMVLMWAEGQA
jgi:hypothetical protein